MIFGWVKTDAVCCHPYLEEADQSDDKWRADDGWTSAEPSAPPPEVAQASEVAVGPEPIAVEEPPPFEHGWGRTWEQWRANSGRYGNRGGRHREWYSAMYRRYHPY